MSNLALYSAFRRWTTFVSESEVSDLKERFAQKHADLHDEVVFQKQKRVKDLLQKWHAAHGMTVARCFLGWRTHARTNKTRKRQLLDQCIRRLSQQQLYAAFRQWTAFIDALKLHTLQSRLQSEKLSRFHQMVRTWSRRSITPVFLEWKSHVRQESQRRRTVMERTCKRLLFRSMTDVLRRWREFSMRTALFSERKQIIAENSQLREQLERDITALRDQREKEIATQRERSEREIRAWNAQREREVSALQARLDRETSALRAQLDRETSELTSQHERNCKGSPRAMRARGKSTHFAA